MTRQETSCPAPRCPGVLRYDLALRGDGYVARCESKEAWSPSDECEAEYRWDAPQEDWRKIVPQGRRSGGHPRWTAPDD